MVFLERYYHLLLVIHLLACGVLMGSMTHNLVLVMRYVRGRFERQALERRFAGVAFWAYVCTYIIGALAYPTYRIYIRHYCFDTQMPWATGVFEVKEHWGVLALAMFAAYYLMRRALLPAEMKGKLLLYVALCFFLNAIVWYKAIIGCVLTMLKGNW